MRNYAREALNTINNSGLGVDGRAEMLRVLYPYLSEREFELIMSKSVGSLVVDKN